MEPWHQASSLPSPSSSPNNSRGTQRRKRGSYVLRACMHCQRRKIKCEGGTPCDRCIARKRDCVSGKHAPSPEYRGRDLAPGELPTAILRTSPSSNVSTAEILHRLRSLERKISMTNEPTSQYVSKKDKILETTSPLSSSTSHSDSPGQVFFGEPYLTAALDDNISDSKEDGDSEICQLRRPRSMTPKHPNRFSSTIPTNSKGWFRSLLLSYGVVARKTEWLGYLETFFGEIHVLYPFLYPGSVWTTLNQIWDMELSISCDDLSGDEELESSIAIVLLCLALGNDHNHPHLDHADDQHAAGWSLYGVAAHLVQNRLDLNRASQSVSLVAIQTLLLMVTFPHSNSRRIELTYCRQSIFSSLTQWIVRRSSLHKESREHTYWVFTGSGTFKTSQCSKTRCLDGAGGACLCLIGVSLSKQDDRIPFIGVTSIPTIPIVSATNFWKNTTGLH